MDYFAARPSVAPTPCLCIWWSWLLWSSENQEVLPLYGVFWRQPVPPPWGGTQRVGRCASLRCLHLGSSHGSHDALAHSPPSWEVQVQNYQAKFCRGGWRLFVMDKDLTVSKIPVIFSLRPKMSADGPEFVIPARIFHIYSYLHAKTSVRCNYRQSSPSHVVWPKWLCLWNSPDNRISAFFTRIYTLEGPLEPPFQSPNHPLPGKPLPCAPPFAREAMGLGKSAEGQGALVVSWKPKPWGSTPPKWLSAMNAHQKTQRANTRFAFKKEKTPQFFGWFKVAVEHPWCAYK